MPNRVIRDSCKTSPTLAQIGNLAERTFWRLTTVMDDFGRYHGDDRAIFAACYPVGAVGVTGAGVKAALLELAKVDLIRFYADGGRRYLYSPKWGRHQRLRAKESKFPPPTENKGKNECRGHVTASGGHPLSNAAGVGNGIGIGDDPPLPPTGGVVGSPRSPKKGHAPPGAFSAFWTRYPRKVGKGKAEAVWGRLRPSSAVQAAILRALVWQVGSDDWTREGGQYIPHPATYLNQRRWEDEPVSAGRRSLDDILGED